MKPTRVAAVIPARMASSRFPGKPLLKVHGFPMVEHVRRRALLCGRFSDVVVATCDREIQETVLGYGGKVVMTSPDHPAATDRVAEAVQSLDCTHVVNVQGDEILVLPEDLKRMVRAIEENPSAPAWNAVATLEEIGELADPSVVKCVVSSSGRILLCSRNFSALGKKLKTPWNPIRRILGILAYRRDFLERYLTLKRTPLETAESIDQSRIIEHDVPLLSVPFIRGYVGINEQREVDVVQACLNEDPHQRAVLQELLAQ